MAWGVVGVSGMFSASLPKRYGPLWLVHAAPCGCVCSCYGGSCELALSPSCFERFSSFIDSEVSQCFHTAVQPPPCNSITLQNRFPQNSDSTANDVKEDVTICHTHEQHKERWVSVIRLSPVLSHGEQIGSWNSCSPLNERGWDSVTILNWWPLQGISLQLNALSLRLQRGTIAQ